MHLRSLPLTAPALLLALACTPDAPRPVADGRAPSDRLPSLRLGWISDSLENAPTTLNTWFAVNAEGTIVLGERGDDALLCTIIDSSGQVIGRAGRKGDGPGEVQGCGPLPLDDGFVIGGARLVRFDRSGQPLATVTLTHLSNPRAYVRPDLLLDLRPTEAGPRLGLTSLTDGSYRPLQAPADSFMANAFGYTLRPDGGTRNPTLGLWPGGFLAGDGWSYRLALYDWDGRLVRVLERRIAAPVMSDAKLDREMESRVRDLRAMGRRLDQAALARSRDQAAGRQQRHFGFHRPTGLDSQGRIWVVGIAGDSGYADVFNAERFLGRLALPCAGLADGWSVAGTWLVLSCLPDDPDWPGDAVFKVFRIEG